MQKNKLTLPFVDMMITQACNLSCTGCTNYSDIVNKGYLTWEEGKAQIAPWLERVDIPDFGILGGEPLMNPRVRDWIRGLRDLLPHSQIRFTTNGLLLEKNFDIVDLLADVGNCVFKITIHEKNENLENVTKRIMSRYDWEPVVEFGVSRFKTKNNFRFHLKRPDIFYKTFKGQYNNMMPHNSDPAGAFDICRQQTCPLLYDGKIYKCSTAGLLKDTLEKFNNPNIEQWHQYLTDGITADCADSELSSFLNNFGKPNKLCGMCPTKADTESTLIHLDNVTRKKIPLYAVK